MKSCERCSQPMERKPGENSRDWDRRRFCSRSCLLSVAPERQCVRCGGQLVRKRFRSQLESIANFKKRKFCGPECCGTRVVRRVVACIEATQ